MIGRLHTGIVLCVMLMLGVVGTVGGSVTDWDYSFAGYAVSMGGMETVIGPKVAELDAKATGFDFTDGPTIDDMMFRNLNVISRVYLAQNQISLDTGGNGPNFVIDPGDYVFTYILDYTNLADGLNNSPINDFQLLRTIDAGGYSNPGSAMALGEVEGGIYNTHGDFTTPPLESYPVGLTGTEYDFVGFQTAWIEFDWFADQEVSAGTKAMVLAVTSPNVSIMQVGWNGTATGEGGNVTGGGRSLSNIPLLIPVVPEPTSLALLLVGASCLLRRTRSRR